MKIFKTGYFYIGYQYKRKKRGCFKIGITGRTPKARENEINKNEVFKIYTSISFNDISKPALEKIEADVRFKLSLISKYNSIQNDHFLYDIENSKKDILEISQKAIEYAEKSYNEIMKIIKEN